ncbi:MAG: tripartite tricarboxylate transporter substrate binding protein [Burkholderiales bacterium]|nr:tripartite tricarboxylate transporter substrate binding protein [Burkholderiales bacterium]
MKRFATLFAAAAICLATRALMAADYPERPIRYLVAFAPGAFNDILARIVAQRMTSALGKPVIVDNRVGAGGNVGAEMAAKATPDGYSLLNISSAHTIAQSLYPKLNYSLERDFTPVVHFASSPLVMAVNASLPVASVSDFISWSKSNKAVYASGGVGVISHLSVEMFKHAIGIDVLHVPYKGGGPGLLDVVAGRAHMMTNTIPTLYPAIKAGRLRALGIMADRRHSHLPEVPTFGEVGYREFVLGNWLGIVAPAGTPRDIVYRLANEVTRIVRSQEVRERFLQEGADATGGTPEELGVVIKNEIVRFGRAVKASGATASGS